MLRFGGVEVNDLNHLINMVSMARVGEPAEVVVWRDRREVKLRVTVGERERSVAQVAGSPAGPGVDASGLLRRPDRPEVQSSYAMGLELATLNPTIAQQFAIPESWRGAVILGVDDASPLARIVKPADVISAIDSEVIQSAEQAVKILNQRTDHIRSILSLDRLANGVMEQHKVQLP